MRWIEIRKEGAVGVMTMNYEGQNRFSMEFCKDLLEAMDTVENDTSIKSLVVTGGEEKYWSTGLHLDYLSRVEPKEANEFIRLFNNVLLKRWCVFPRPTVAAINGHVFAAGAVMACHLDYRFMREDRGWACFPEVDINIPFLPGMLAIIREVLTPQAMRDMLLTGKRYTGPEAKKIGFVDEIYSKEELLPKSIEWAEFLATKNIPAYAEIKRRMRAGVVKIIEEEDPKFFSSVSK